MVARYVNILFLLLCAVVISACSASTNIQSVESAISTYDKTFTKNVRSKESIKESISNPLRFTSSKNKVASFASRLSSDDAGNANKPYFMEFRARAAHNYGHASVVFGKLRNGKIPVNSKGVLDPKRVQITGLHPATDDPKQWVKGHFQPVPAETGPSDGDFEDAYVTARYQVNLTKAEFDRLVRIVNKHKRSYNYWYAVNYATNCLGYMASIAADMGMKVPAAPRFPKSFVQQLKSINS
ncbi:MAG: hypothetical protein AAF217_14090 [Pseudomonadota bacterium]